MAYIEKEKKVMHHSAKTSVQFCEIIHYTQWAPFGSQKRNTVKNQKKMEMKWKQRGKLLTGKYKDNTFEKYWSITQRIKDICKEWKRLLCQREAVCRSLSPPEAEFTAIIQATSDKEVSPLLWFC